jgi:hypothetical protein
MVLRLIRDLPGDRAFLPPSPARPLVEQLSANLASASGGQDHTTSPSARVKLVLHHLSRPSHPASTSVTVATPLCNEAGWVAVDTDFRKLASETFSRGDWTGDPIETVRKMSFSRMSCRQRSNGIGEPGWCGLRQFRTGRFARRRGRMRFVAVPRGQRERRSRSSGTRAWEEILPDIRRAEIVITNYHVFQHRETIALSRSRAASCGRWPHNPGRPTLAGPTPKPRTG